MGKNATLWPAKDTLPVPAHQNIDAVRLWTDYAVWGLDIYDNQPTWFSVIEMILVITDRHRKGISLLAEMPLNENGAPAHENVSYDIYYNHNLRHLMFRDQDILPLSERNTTDQQALWSEWLSRYKKDFGDLELGYLQNAFAGDFNKFSEAVDLLRSAEVEPMHAKRWSSRHLLPIGDAVIFPDYQPTKNTLVGGLDRRFFRRTGELLFLMLSRASAELKAELEPLLVERFFSDINPWNAIAKKLQGPDADLNSSPKISTSVGYLPYARLERYDLLAEDWSNILRLRSIPLEDTLDYLMRMSGLNEIVYVVERAAATCGMAQRPIFYLDMIGGAQGNHVRQASVENYKIHKGLTRKAIEAYIHSYVETPEWQAVGDSGPDCETAKKLISERFLFETSHTSAHPVRKEDQVKELLEAAANRSHAIGSAFTAHARQIGFLSLKQGVGGWYSPTDALLEALVIANVNGITEFSLFLKRIYDRYGMVIGSEEAKRASNVLHAPGETLVANERRFEERLLVLGFIDRKSDDCAFVVNPFHESNGK
ncbi:hypothetical protein [Ensifer aridi]|uniref:hypothetical protein n=1 Tax=Ensifer aridi TaxID=1708715 RepID=UPI000A10CF32|nr:hypothetical protein [Ensifer aridi]